MARKGGIDRGLYQNARGDWCIEWHDAEHRRHREKVGKKSHARLLYQKRKADALARRKLPELFARPQVATFNELADDALTWSRLHKRSHREDAWRIRRLRDRFGKRLARDVTPAAVEHFMAEEIRAGKRPATVNRSWALLSLVFRLAVEHGKLDSNPCARVRQLAEHNKRQRFLSPEEESRLRAAIAARWPRRLAELDIALHTGLRQGEQYGLRWPQVDFERRLIVLPLTKPGDAHVVRLNDTALAAFRSLLPKRRRELAVTASSVSPLSPLSPLGDHTGVRVFDIKNPREWFKMAKNDAKIEDFRWHDLRHTVGSRATQAGVPLRFIQQFLGHKSLTTTERYSHLAPEYQKDVVKALESFGKKAAKVGQSEPPKTATSG
ncbi:MAG TPA: site-specific integrase [Candidatus Acidoferrales bacterium]|nr:site-specific integrase [Candidatus Acidoferrales bacterium]